MGMEIYNLLPQVDAIIGDYSSLCMQSLLLDKPMAYVVPDMEEYSKRRGFAFDPPTDYMLYATDPIGTITTNLIGAQNMLEFSAQHNAVRFLLASSNEMYGENRGDVEFYDEDYCGYINCNTLRAGYPESKRCSEALCQAYKQQKGLDVVIARLTRSYGPTMNMSDTKAVSQFIKRGVAGEDIILKSEGTQYFSYTYMSDAVSGLLWVLLTGENGEA